MGDHLDKMYSDLEKLGTYKFAIQWIAVNDEPTVTSVDEMAGLISVLLVADLFGVDSRRVAEDVEN